MADVNARTDAVRAKVAEHRALAEAATPAPWECGDTEVVASADLITDHPDFLGQPMLDPNGPMEIAECYRGDSGERRANAAHTAANDPAHALAMCDLADTLLSLFDYYDRALWAALADDVEQALAVAWGVS